MPKYPRRAPTKARRKNKRWYVDASIPKSVPFIGGSAFRAGSGTLAKRSIQNIARQVVNSQKETKVFLNSIVVNPVNNNQLYSFAPTQLIKQGLASNQRDGDAIFLRKVKCRFKIEWIPSVGFDTVKWKVMMIWLPKQLPVTQLVAPAVTTLIPSGQGVQVADVWQASNLPLAYGLINNKTAAKVICQKEVTFNNVLNSNGVQQKDFDIDCSIFKKMQFTPNPTYNYFKDENLYLIVTASTPGGTTSTSVGSFILDTLVTFTDS